MKIFDFETAAAIKASLAEDYLLSGSVKLNACQYPQALDDFTEALNLTPDSYPALLSCGLACTAMGDKEEAQDYFNRALEINPDSGVAHYHLGIYHFEAGEFEAAVENFNLFLQEETSEDAIFFLYRGQALSELGWHEEAIESYNEALRYDDELAMAYFLRSSAHKALGKMSEAKKDYRRALALEPELVSGFRADQHMIPNSQHFNNLKF
jgi:tetratricopeptide (TPR) repeat protein